MAAPSPTIEERMASLETQIAAFEKDLGEWKALFRDHKKHNTRNFADAFERISRLEKVAPSLEKELGELKKIQEEKWREQTQQNKELLSTLNEIKTEFLEQKVELTQKLGDIQAGIGTRIEKHLKKIDGDKIRLYLVLVVEGLIFAGVMAFFA